MYPTKKLEVAHFSLFKTCLLLYFVHHNKHPEMHINTYELYMNYKAVLKFYVLDSQYKITKIMKMADG